MVVTGANRGIGLEVTKQMAAAGWLVVAVARSAQAIGPVVTELQKQGLRVEPRVADITRKSECDSLAAWTKKQNLNIDVLINNAGVFKESQSDGSSDILKVDTAMVMETINVNTLGPLRLIQSIEPLLESGARVINVSSVMGQISTMSDEYLGYRLSKLALNGLTKLTANRLKDQGIIVNAVCPGWVRSDMGGEHAKKSLTEGADTIVWLASNETLTESGGFYCERELIDW